MFDGVLKLKKMTVRPRLSRWMKSVQGKEAGEKWGRMTDGPDGHVVLFLIPGFGMPGLLPVLARNWTSANYIALPRVTLVPWHAKTL